jgi:hypothetical protein
VDNGDRLGVELRDLLVWGWSNAVGRVVIVDRFGFGLRDFRTGALWRNSLGAAGSMR